MALLRNQYTCVDGHKLPTEHRDEGTSPMFITCPKCGKRAGSGMYREFEGEPIGEWIIPKDIKDWDRILANDKAQYPDMDLTMKKVRNLYAEHLRMGGVCLVWNDTPVPIVDAM